MAILTGLFAIALGAPEVAAQTAADLDPVALPLNDFAPARAYGHVERLVEIGPRVSGTEGAEKTREYLREELRVLGADVQEIETRDARNDDPESEPYRHLVGVLRGASQDRILLVAHYDTFPAESFEFLGANSSASGTAMVLELGGVLAERDLPYTVWLVFVDGEETPAGADGNQPSWAGSRSLAGHWARDGGLGGIRAAFFVGQVCDPDLVIARDLRSNRNHRRRVWQVADELGHDEQFPRSASFTNPVGSHTAFVDRGVREAVLVTDESFGGAEPPGFMHFTEQDSLETCSIESLEVVGDVIEVSLDRLQDYLVRIDGFVIDRSPPPAEAAGASEPPGAD